MIRIAEDKAGVLDDVYTVVAVVRARSTTQEKYADIQAWRLIVLSFFRRGCNTIIEEQIMPMV